jgi:hypothetical protein
MLAMMSAIMDNERGMSTESPPPEPAEKSEEQPGSSPLWLTVSAVLVLGGAVELIIYGYVEKPGWIGSSGKQFWDYLDLLIVPAALALGVYWLNRSQGEREHQAEVRQRERELEIENQRAQDATLQTYIDKIGQLVERYRASVSAVEAAKLEYHESVDDYNLFKDVPVNAKGMLEDPRGTGWSVNQNLPKNEMQKSKSNYIDAATRCENMLTEIRAHTLAVLERIEDRPQGSDEPKVYKRRKRAVMSVLAEAGFLNLGSPRPNFIEGANLTYTDLKSIVEEANFADANLKSMNLSHKNLQKVRLTGADLSDSNFVGADLTGADLEGARGVTNEELEQQAASLEGATMPDGQKYEDWLLSQGSGEDGKNSGPS